MRRGRVAMVAALLLIRGGGLGGRGQPGRGQTPPRQPADAVHDAQTPRPAGATRPELRQTDHDRSGVFAPDAAPPSSTALPAQPDGGRALGFDFARDPLNAKKPMQTFDETMKEDVAAKPGVMDTQRQPPQTRYTPPPRLDPAARMSRGKPLAVGPTARLGGGLTWDRLASVKPDEIRSRKAFPYPALPHPQHATGGMVFPPMQIAMFPRLERFDVDFDLPEAFLPEFPPAIFLSNRPELGDVSRGEVVSINNFRELFKDLLTPVQMEGFRMLLTPLPQEEFNATDDRKSREPSL